jgi:CRISPR-associated endoribonuclease Cas6
MTRSASARKSSSKPSRSGRLSQRSDRRSTRQSNRFGISWAEDTELVGLRFRLVPQRDAELYAQYTIGLHAWFLQQIQQTHPHLSQQLHDQATEKAFTLSGLNGQFIATGQQLRLQKNQTYEWTITVLSHSLVEWLAHWLATIPDTLELRNAGLQIAQAEIVYPATTYAELAQLPCPNRPALALSFRSPTSFRRKKNHFPLPVPMNLFHSYLRRWNDLSGILIDADSFLEWIDDFVIIRRHRLESIKVAAGKQGSVTGFTGAIELALSQPAFQTPEYVDWFYRLGQFAPYCGTGHKTTFGLGQTQLGWGFAEPEAINLPVTEWLPQRIADLTELFISQRKRTGGDRAMHIAETWATILARREIGDPLFDIADDLEMPYETVKTYSKLAQRSLREAEQDED